MIAYVHEENCDGPGVAVAGFSTPLESGDTVYVHLCSGQVVLVRPANAVRVTDDALEVLQGEEIVAHFPRSNVYFASDNDMEPPSLE